MVKLSGNDGGPDELHKMATHVAPSHQRYRMGDSGCKMGWRGGVCNQKKEGRRQRREGKFKKAVSVEHLKTKSKKYEPQTGEEVTDQHWKSGGKQHGGG